MKEELAKEIREFLAKHANRSASDEAEYSSPDASMLEAAAIALEHDLPIPDVWSSWESGGYSPYTDKAGKRWHEEILSKLRSASNPLVGQRFYLNKKHGCIPTSGIYEVSHVYNPNQQNRYENPTHANCIKVLKNGKLSQSPVGIVFVLIAWLKSRTPD